MRHRWLFVGVWLLGVSAAATAEDVVWTNAVGVSVSGNSLAKTGASAAWDAGASSLNVLPDGYGYVEFTATETTIYTRPIASIGLLAMTLAGAAAEDDMARFLRPKPVEAYVYKLTQARKPAAGGGLVVTAAVVTAESTGEQGAIHVKETPQIAGVSLPTGASVLSSDYVLRAAGGQLTKTVPEGETVVVMKEPLTVGTPAWGRRMRVHLANGGTVDYTDSCSITARNKSAILGAERSTITLACQIKSPNGELLITEQYAFELGMVKRQTDYRVDGKTTGADELILESITPESSTR